LSLTLIVGHETMKYKSQLCALFVSTTLSITCSVFAASPGTESPRQLCPSNADLIIVTRDSTLWATTTPNPPPQNDSGMPPHGWQHKKTDYYTVIDGTTNHYRTVRPFHETENIGLSKGGSILVGNTSVLISSKDFSRSVNTGQLYRVDFEPDVRNYDGWSFDPEYFPILDSSAINNASSPIIAMYLNVTTSGKKGCRIPLYSYSATNISDRWRGYDRSRPLRLPPLMGNWQRIWPIRRLGRWNDRFEIWNGHEWQDVGLSPLTKVVASIVINYFWDNNIRSNNWGRISYVLEDDGCRTVSKHNMYTDSGVSGYWGSIPVPDLDADGIREAEGIVNSLPPSTGLGLTNQTIQVSYSRDPIFDRKYIRIYPCAEVPLQVMRLLELLGGYQYEAAEILKPAVPMSDINRGQQGGAGYPPQGVGSADP
jgi:hypothetical protein